MIIHGEAPFENLLSSIRIILLSGALRSQDYRNPTFSVRDGEKCKYIQLSLLHIFCF